MDYIPEIVMKKEEFISFERFVLAGDVGGTNTVLGVFGIVSGKVKKIFSFRFQSIDTNSFYSAINETLKYAKEEYGIGIDTACFGCAGPIDKNGKRVKLTNVNVVVDCSEVFEKTMLSNIALVNDFQAICYGLELMKEEEMDFINKNRIEVEGVKAVIGAGTGLGEGISVFDKGVSRYRALASEGGNSVFCPVEELEWELKKFYEKNTNSQATMESFVSGSGLVHIFNFLVYYLEDNGEYDIREEIQRSDLSLKPALISKYGIDEDDEYCKKALDLFIGLYARAAKNLALTALPFGGLYISGGITSKIKDKIKDKIFLEEFETHPTQSDVLKRVPIIIINEKDAGLRGAANVALNFKDKLIQK